VSLEKAKACFGPSEYAKAITLRADAAEFSIVIAEGVTPT
jgi:uncharacterized protein (DUF1330 family)